MHLFVSLISIPESAFSGGVDVCLFFLSRYFAAFLKASETNCRYLYFSASYFLSNWNEECGLLLYKAPASISMQWSQCLIHSPMLVLVQIDYCWSLALYPKAIIALPDLFKANFFSLAIFFGKKKSHLLIARKLAILQFSEHLCKTQLIFRKGTRSINFKLLCSYSWHMCF